MFQRYNQPLKITFEHNLQVECEVWDGPNFLPIYWFQGSEKMQFLRYIFQVFISSDIRSSYKEIFFCSNFKQVKQRTR